ncbi:ATP-binding protein [Streptomyces sp. NPDC005722]
MRTVRDRLDTARRRSFVGRADERHLFAAALAGETGAFSVFYVHGPGGIGKSTLLNRFAADARDAGRPVVEVDGRLVEASPRAFENAVGDPAEGMVLVIDTFERCQGLETWLSRQFLPRLPYDAIVVLASRIPPTPGWRADPAWSETLRVIRLRNLDPDDAAVLMEKRGVAEHLRARVLGFTGGHPLALTLAAEVARDEPGTLHSRYPSPSWEPGQEVVASLLGHLVGEVPSDHHRRALAVCAHAEATTEELVRAVVPADQAGALFTWLRGLAFTESGAHGVYPHDVVRNALEADLRWRDPEGYASIHRSVRRHLLDRVRAAADADALRTVRELLFTFRRSPVMAAFLHWGGAEDVFGDRYQEADRQEVLDLARRAEGPELAAIVNHWLGRAPEAFQVCRRTSTGLPVGFSAWLRLSEPDEHDRRTDPVIDAAWNHVADQGGLRPGEHLGISRFFVDPEQYERSSPVMDQMLFRNAQAWLMGNGLAWSFCVAAHSRLWQENFAGIQHTLVPDTKLIGATEFALFARDWRRTPLEPWLDLLTTQAMSGQAVLPDADEEEYSVLSRPEFDDAVRAALRTLHSDALADNPLVRSHLVATGNLTDRTRELRELLTRTIRAMAVDQRLAKLHRVLDATFLGTAPTQELAAQSLAVPFTTYRRHLTRGTELLCDRLWRQELAKDD